MYFIDDVLYLINYCYKFLNLRMFFYIWLFIVLKWVFYYCMIENIRYICIFYCVLVGMYLNFSGLQFG